jgi:hypothetical protein
MIKIKFYRLATESSDSVASLNKDTESALRLIQKFLKIKFNHHPRNI